MRYVCCLVLLGLVAGCTGAPDSAPALYPVTGELIVGGKPLADIQIQLTPVDLQAKMKPGLGKTDAEGKFTIITNGDKGANPGKYKVVLSTQTVAQTGEYSLEEAMKQSGQYAKTGGPPKPTAPPFPPEWGGAQTSPKEVEVTKQPLHIKIDI